MLNVLSKREPFKEQKLELKEKLPWEKSNAAGEANDPNSNWKAEVHLSRM